MEKFDIDTLAALSKLAPSDSEKKALTENLESVLEYVEQLQKVATATIPASHRQALTEETLREDEAVESDTVSRELILKNFPERKGDLLKSPDVFE